jgi:hypothetical protein
MNWLKVVAALLILWAFAGCAPVDPVSPNPPPSQDDRGDMH